MGIRAALGASSWRTGLLAGVAAVTLSVSAFAAPFGDSDAEDEYRDLDELPTTAADIDDIEPTAVALVDALGGVPTSDDPPTLCPSERLEVSWDEPVGFEQGAYVGEVGPPPTREMSEVLGIVVCDGSRFAFTSFEAVQQDDGTWELSVVPVFEEETELGQADQRSMDLMARELPDQEVGIGEFGQLELLELGSIDLGPIDPYAPYEPQRLCHPDPKPGTVALGRLLLELYPETSNFGIARGCDVGPRSEHKEGRAFDWGADVFDAEQRAAVEDFFGRLLATDEEGNRHALARRLGVMYMIWDGEIWSSHRADEGWRPYHGPSTHVDHVHISLSWDGAMGQTSLWQAALPDGWWAAFPALAAPRTASDTGTASYRMTWWGTDDEALFFRTTPSDDGTTTQRSSTNDEDGSTQQDGGTTQDDGGSTSDDELTTTTDTVEDTATSTVDETGDTVDDTVDDTEETVDDTVDDTQDSLDDTTDDATEPIETESPLP